MKIEKHIILYHDDFKNNTRPHLLPLNFRQRHLHHRLFLQGSLHDHLIQQLRLVFQSGPQVQSYRPSPQNRWLRHQTTKHININLRFFSSPSWSLPQRVQIDRE